MTATTPPPTCRPSCPTCGGPVGSLLAGCFKPACLTAELDYDALFTRLDDN